MHPQIVEFEYKFNHKKVSLLTHTQCPYPTSSSSKLSSSTRIYALSVLSILTWSLRSGLVRLAAAEVQPAAAEVRPAAAEVQPAAAEVQLATAEVLP